MVLSDKIQKPDRIFTGYREYLDESKTREVKKSRG